MAHNLTTGRVMTAISATGDTVMATVPAGYIWQVLSSVIHNVTQAPGNVGQIRFVDGVTGAIVWVHAAVPNLAGVSSLGRNQVNLAAGDHVVFHAVNVAQWQAMVSYIQR